MTIPTNECIVVLHFSSNQYLSCMDGLPTTTGDRMVPSHDQKTYEGNFQNDLQLQKKIEKNK